MVYSGGYSDTKLERIILSNLRRRIYIIVIALVLMSLGILVIGGIYLNSGKEPSVYRVAVHPNGELISINFSDFPNSGDTVVLNLDFEKVYETKSSFVSGTIYSPLAWNPNQTQIATSFGHSSGVRIVDVENGQTNELTNAEIPVNWSSDGKLIASSSKANEVIIYDTDDYQLLDTLPSFTYTENEYDDLVSSLKWSPSTDYIATVYSSSVRVWDWRTNEVVYTVDESAKSISWNQDNNIAISFYDMTIIVEPTSGEVIESIDVDADLISWMPNSRQLLYSRNNRLTLLEKFEESSLIQEYVGHGSKIIDITWMPDGTKILSVDLTGRLLMWDASTGEILHSLRIDELVD